MESLCHRGRAVAAGQNSPAFFFEPRSALPFPSDQNCYVQSTPFRPIHFPLDHLIKSRISSTSSTGDIILKIGVISDTHGLFDKSVASIFDGVELIIHAGDIGKLEVITSLEEIAPVLAVEGNNDSFGLFPIERAEELSNNLVLIRHIFGELHQLRASDKEMVKRVRPDVVIFGHSHRPYQQMLGETLLFNPGSAGPRRFSLPRTVGLLSLDTAPPVAQIVKLD